MTQRDTTLPQYPSADRKNIGYAIRYIKALMASDAIRDIGMEAVLLCVFVASCEDKLHYAKPPKYWRKEMMNQFGKGSPKDLNRIRKAAEDAGLLHHVPGTRTKMGVYWTLVPEWLPMGNEPFPKGNGTKPNRSQKGTDQAANRSQKGTERGTERGTLSIPSTHTPKKKKTEPSFDHAKVDLPFGSDEFREAWEDYCEMRREVKKALTPTAAKAALKKLGGWEEADACDALENSTASQWQGLFLPDKPRGRADDREPTTPPPPIKRRRSPQ
ncbi:hypothetical protein [Novipirellula sp.]|uniref:hypothetical protein n=1 Tax=Novipirellula sp. TaxID=2795430 RepID=UPI003568BC88